MFAILNFFSTMFDRQKTFSLIRRVAGRTIVLAVLTTMAFVSLDLLVYLGREGISDINSRFPELIAIVRAAAIMAWIEVSILLIRVSLAPRTDVQTAVKVAELEPMSAAIVYAVHTLAWAIRFAFFLKLCEFL